MIPLLAVAVSGLVVDSLPKTSDSVRAADQLVLVAVAFTAAVAMITAHVLRKIENRRGTEPHTPSQVFAPDISSIKAHDSDFVAADFIESARSTFMAVQKARHQGKAEDVRHLLSDDLWQPFNEVQKKTAAANRSVIIEHLKLHKATLQSALNIQGWDSITVRMVASCAEYERDQDGTKMGDRHIRMWREDWTFERSADPATRLRSTWCLTSVQPVAPDRFGAQTRRSMTEWNPTPAMPKG